MSSMEFRRVNEPWPDQQKAPRMRPMWQIMLIGSGLALAILSPLYVLRFGYWMGWWGL